MVQFINGTGQMAKHLKRNTFEHLFHSIFKEISATLQMKYFKIYWNFKGQYNYI